MYGVLAPAQTISKTLPGGVDSNAEVIGVTKRIAVEDGLEPIKDALREEGFDVTHFSERTLDRVDAAVVTGMSDNFLGINRTEGRGFSVIEARGMTAEEVVRQVKSRLNNQ